MFCAQHGNVKFTGIPHIDVIYWLFAETVANEKAT